MPAAMRSWLPFASGMLLALVAGIGIGRITGSSGSADSSADAAKSSRVGSGAAAGAAGRGGREDAASARARARAAQDVGGATANGAGLAAILDTPSRLDRTQRLLAFLDRLPVEQFGAVYQEFRDSPLAALRGSERSLVLQAWAERDPFAALGFLQQNGAEDWERETAVGAWASKDPQAAMAWAESAPDEGTVNNWQLGALRGIAATSPELARDLLARMPASETRGRALESMRPYVARQGFDYAAGWIDGIGDAALHGEAARMMAGDLASLDPARAGSWNASIADTEVRRAVSETVSDRWARVDLDAAKRWVEGLPENTRTEAAEGIARQYARQDPAEAANWLARLGNNPDLDGARRVFIEESFRRDPAASLGFVVNLTDAKAREGYYNRLVNGWMHRDAEAARAWVNANATTLPQGVVNRALR